ncbi:VWA domain-containing protein [Caldisalinibacter kiritimatiensis]|uniref:von Willebrand factor type A domain protein n=1 Tax=Caldisalinibacter kiritimatiensis TaxID=1304284 RepID=R1CGV7_9FIRM|nr:vWA domain-containing protein [Caldisalinibacter kiritimatiensis]EOD01525.1 von Willebrand factor type A domain protein [Caldisalinibacter kiritimatiensis]
MKRNINLRISYFLMIMILSITFLPISKIYADTNTDISISAPVNMFREVEKNQVLIGEEFTINYKFQPQPIPAEDIIPEAYLKDKEIVLVIDTSGSMKTNDMVGNKTRMEVVKDAAAKFLEKLKDDERVNISLIEYDNYAELKKNNGNEFVNLSQGNNFNEIINNISKPMDASGGTNIGDGLRRAYYTLNNSNNQDARKYIVFLTDGEPTAFSFNRFVNRWIDWGWTDWGLLAKYHYNDYFYGEPITLKKREYKGWSLFNRSSIGKLYCNNFEEDVYDIIDYDFKTDNYDDIAYFTNWGSNDYNDYALNYARIIANMIKNSPNNIDSFFIAFSNGSNRNKLREISEECDGYYKEAIDANAINEVYEQLSEQILSDLPIHAVYYEETFPDEFEIVDIPEGMIRNGNTVVGDIGSITYNLNKETNQFEAESFEFNIKLRAIKEGEYNLSSEIAYKDIDGSEKVRLFPDANISVYENEPPKIDATVERNPNNDDKYNLSITIDEPGYIEILNANNDIVWQGDCNTEGTFNILIDKSKIEGYEGHNIKIRATDIYNNVVEETVPIIEISSLEIEDKLNENGNRDSILSIKTEDNTKITEIRINDELIAQDRLTDNGEYSQKLELIELLKGTNKIEIKVLNGYNNSSKFEFNVDVEPLLIPNIISNEGKLEYGLYIQRSTNEVVLDNKNPVNIVVGFEAKLGAAIETIGSGELEVLITSHENLDIHDIKLYKCEYNDTEDSYTIGDLLGSYQTKSDDDKYKFNIDSENNTFMLVYSISPKTISEQSTEIKLMDNVYDLNINIQELPELK